MEIVTQAVETDARTPETRTPSGGDVDADAGACHSDGGESHSGDGDPHSGRRRSALKAKETEAQSQETGTPALETCARSTENGTQGGGDLHDVPGLQRADVQCAQANRVADRLDAGDVRVSK